MLHPTTSLAPSSQRSHSAVISLRLGSVVRPASSSMPSHVHDDPTKMLARLGAWWTRGRSSDASGAHCCQKNIVTRAEYTKVSVLLYSGVSVC